MSEFEPEIVQPADATSDGLDFASFDPLVVARAPAAGRPTHGPHRAWSWLMYTMGKRAPDNLAKAARYRQAMLKLRHGTRRMR